jgi:hypothetical protein
MEKVFIRDLRFSNLRGDKVALNDYFQDYALLIFLRHLA